MKILIVNAGNETGGGRAHMVWLIGALNKIPGIEAELLVFEDSAVAKMAREYQVKTTVIAQNSQLDLSVLKRYRNFVNDNHFDIVHTHGPRANVLTRFIQHKINATWVVTVHSEPHVDFPKGGLKGKAFLKLNINALKKAKHLYLITDYFRDELHSYGIPDGDMTPIFNAINFHDTPIDRPEHEPFNILNVARVTYVKNQALLLKALAQVDFDYKVTILGDGPLEQELKDLAKTLQIQDKVDVAGFTENTQPYYDQADLFVLPSTSEGFPTVLLEAADAELPAIATKVGSDDVVIPNADLGWIFPSDDQAALVKALAEAHGEFEAGTLVNRGKAFKNFAASHFSADNLAKTMVDLYQQAQK